jgi:hypothetical protein
MAIKGFAQEYHFKGGWLPSLCDPLSKAIATFCHLVVVTCRNYEVNTAIIHQYSNYLEFQESRYTLSTYISKVISFSTPQYDTIVTML